MRLITEIITEEEAAELHRIHVAYLEGKIKSYTLEEHKAIIMSKFKGMGKNSKQLSNNHFRTNTRDSK